MKTDKDLRSFRWSCSSAIMGILFVSEKEKKQEGKIEIQVMIMQMN
jgi:hypothetical protein